MPHLLNINVKKISLKYHNKKKTFEIMVLKFVCLQFYINFFNKNKRFEFNVTMFL